MKVTLREIFGVWDQGWVLDKHSLGSICVGYYGDGRPKFETTRTEVGEATFLLKYRSRWDQVEALARTLADNIYPKFDQVGFILPMPASISRPRQPVTAIAQSLGTMVSRPVFTNLLQKSAGGRSLKDLTTKEEKVDALGDGFSINDPINGDGPLNALLIDDLYHTGATMETACNALKAFPKVGNVYVAALTWR